MPSGIKRGVCRVCNEEADSQQGTYCAEHRPLSQDMRPNAAGTTQRRAGNLEVELRTNLAMAGQLWAVRDPVCGAMLVQQAPEIARYWADRARSSERIARTLEGVVSSGGWLGGVAVHLPLVLAVWAHHVEPAIATRRAEQQAAQEEADAAMNGQGRWTPPANDPAAQAAAAAFSDLHAAEWPDGGAPSS